MAYHCHLIAKNRSVSQAAAGGIGQSVPIPDFVACGTVTAGKSRTHPTFSWQFQRFKLLACGTVRIPSHIKIPACGTGSVADGRWQKAIADNRTAVTAISEPALNAQIHSPFHKLFPYRIKKLR